MTSVTPSTPSRLEPTRQQAASTLIALQIDPGQLPEGLGIGTRVEIRLARQPDPGLVRLQVSPLTGAAAGTIIEPQPVGGTQARLLVQAADTAASLPTRDGPRLSGEVVGLGSRLVLRLGTIGTAADTSPADQTSTDRAVWFQSQWRQHLPHSLALARTLDGWRQPTPHTQAPGSAAARPMTPLAARLASDLLAGLPEPADLTDPHRLRHAVGHSGLWLEAALARQTPDPGRDLKAQLTRLAERIRTLQRPEGREAPPQTPQRTPDPEHETGGNRPSATVTGHPRDPARQADALSAADDDQLAPSTRAAATSQAPDPGAETRQRAGRDQTLADDQATRALRTLDRQVAGMLEKIVTNQLVTLDASPDQPRWLLELPFRTPSGVAELEADIRRERRSPEQEDETWHMRLRLDLPRLGPLTIRLSLRADRLSAGLHAASATSGALLNRNLPLLRERLTARSIDIASLHAGQRPDPGPAVPTGSGTLSERA